MHEYNKDTKSCPRCPQLECMVPQYIMLIIKIIVVTSIVSGDFAGYYCCILPERCWDSKGQKLVHDENWGSERVVMSVDTNSKEVTKITSDPERKGVWSVLDVSCDIIVAQFSTPNSPPQLVSLHVPCSVFHVDEFWLAIRC